MGFVEDRALQPTLGDLVRAARDERGWSQLDLAERLGLSQRWVSDIENNAERSPRVRNLRGLANALGLDLAEVIIRANLARTRAEALRVAESDAPAVDPFDVRTRIAAALADLDDDQANIVLDTIESIKRHQRQRLANPDVAPSRGAD